MKRPSIYLTLGLLAAAPMSAPAIDLMFFDQANLRFMNDADMQMMSASVDAVLASDADDASDGWSNPDTGASGTAKALSRFDHDGMACRRISVENRVPGASQTGGAKRADLCLSDGKWKLLGFPE